jgi:signal transduction histidine kinase
MLLYLGLSLLGTLPVLVFVYHQTDRIVLEGYKQRIEDREENLRLSHETGGVPGLARAIQERIAAGAAAHGAVLLVDPSGRKLAGNVAAWPPTLRAPIGWAQMRLFRDGHDEAELFALSTTRLSSGHRLLVGTLIEDHEAMREALAAALAGALALSIPIGLLGGLVLTRAMNRRVKDIGNVAARIAAGDLSQRVQTDGSQDPFDRLGGSLNGMLARIEALIEELRLVTDALAHDLRSPLTRIRASIEGAAGKTPHSDPHEALEAISHEVDGMLRMLAGTLEISRTEAGMGRENFSRFQLGQLIRDLCEMYQPLAEECGIAIAVDELTPIGFFGNRELIGQAVANLVDNSIKYGAEGGSIRIGAEQSDSEVRIWVADRGPGIPEERRQEAVRKYRRLDQARGTEGSGLGLALVGAVARLHQGELIFEDNRPGLRAVIRLPRIDGSDQANAGSPD